MGRAFHAVLQVPAAAARHAAASGPDCPFILFVLWTSGPPRRLGAAAPKCQGGAAGAGAAGAPRLAVVRTPGSMLAGLKHNPLFFCSLYVARNRQKEPRSSGRAHQIRCEVSRGASGVDPASMATG